VNDAPTTLLDITRGISLEFLHSVVLIDDRVYLGSVPPEAAPAAFPEEIVAPRRRGATPQTDEPVSPTTAIVTVSTAEHPLDAKPLLDRFAEQGLLCATLRVDDSAEAKRTVKAARRADIVVLDWKINGLYGDTTIELIREILSGTDVDRLRLIAIYTGENNLVEIMRRVQTELDALIGDKVRYRKDEPFAITRGPVRVVLYAKAETKLPEEDPELHQRIAPAAELPDRLLSEFASMTSGLVSNVALDALAKLRVSMHRILRRLHPGLDAAYLSHRALVSQPEEAEDHLVALVASEIATVLDQGGVGHRADLNAIRTWLQERIAAGADFRQTFNLGTQLDPLDALCELLKLGVDHASVPTQFGQLKAKKHAMALTARFCPVDINPDQCDSEFAMLLTLRERDITRPPDLTLGTILARTAGANVEYFLCMQASCDALRVDTDRSYPLLPLVPVTKEQDPFDVIVVENGKVFRFKASSRPYEKKMIDFAPSTSSRTVKPLVQGAEMVFKAVDGREYRWVGELKPEHAQRLLNELGAQQTRVGVTEPEWMRRSRN
jgi:Response receiver domain